MIGWDHESCLMQRILAILGIVSFVEIKSHCMASLGLIFSMEFGHYTANVLVWNIMDQIPPAGWLSLQLRPVTFSQT